VCHAQTSATEQTKKPSPEQKSQGQEKPSVEVIMTKKNYVDSVKKLQEIDKNLPDEKTKQWIETALDYATSCISKRYC
jgi:hypothetical protein